MSVPPREMRAPALLEHAIYGPDLEALERFYVDVCGLLPVVRATGRLIALRCGNAVLLLFDPSVTRVPGPVPEHGCDGAGHIAFVIEPEEQPAWRAHLARHGVAIEREVEWPEGGTSIYFRDPAGNSVELAPPAIGGGAGHDLLRSLARHGDTPASNP